MLYYTLRSQRTFRQAERKLDTQRRARVHTQINGFV